MDELSFIAAIVQAVVWPIFLVVILLLFRKPVAELIPKLRTIRIGSVEASAVEEYREKMIESLRENTETLQRLQEDLQSARRADAPEGGSDEPNRN